MAFCINCGTKLPDEVKFCPTCGAAQQVQQVAVATAKGHMDLAAALVLIGGVLDLVVLIPSIAGALGFTGAMMGQYGEFNMFGFPRFVMLFGVSLALIMMWAGVALVGALLAIYSGLKLHQDYTKRAATIGIVGGVLLLITFSLLPGLFVLAGSFLAYVE